MNDYYLNEFRAEHSVKRSSLKYSHTHTQIAVHHPKTYAKQLYKRKIKTSKVYEQRHG